jgi:hypothetical protein
VLKSLDIAQVMIRIRRREASDVGLVRDDLTDNERRAVVCEKAMNVLGGAWVDVNGYDPSR